MTRLYPTDIAGFARKYRFAGGRVRRLGVRRRGDEVTLTFDLVVRPTATSLAADADPVRLRFRLEGVSEFRFQQRPGAGGRITEARFGYFGDVYYVNLDAWGLAPGETPKLHDFRGSDAYVGARELFWELVPPKSPPSGQ